MKAYWEVSFLKLFVFDKSGIAGPTVNSLGSEVLTTVVMKYFVFWDITP
jgi:hypothetical protein